MVATFVGIAQRAAAWEGCYRDGNCIGWCDEGAPFNGFVGDDTVDYYIDDSLYGQAQVLGMPAATVEALIKQALASFRAEVGSTVAFRYRGHSTDIVCDTNSFAKATLIIDATPPNGNLGSFQNCNSNDWGCAYTQTYLNDLKCGRITFVGGNQPGLQTGPTGFRKLVMHEAMHILNFAHLSSEWCGARSEDESVVEGSNIYYRWLTNADKRYLLEDYGAAPGSIWWRRASPPGVYSFSDPTLLHPTGQSTSPVRTTSADGREHGVAFLEWNGEETFARTVFYENGAWGAPQTIGPERVFHPPAVTHSYEGPPGLARWLVASAGTDTWGDQTKDYRGHDRAINGTWGTLPWLGLNNENPHVAADYDPQTNRWVLLYTNDDGQLRTRTAQPGGLSWDGFTAMPDLPAGQGLRCFGAPDVACGPTDNPGMAHTNCLAVCLSDVRNAANAPNSLPGTIWLVPFSVNVNGTSTWSNPVDTGVTAEFGPRIAANPLPDNELLFVILVSGVGAASSSGYYTKIYDIWWQEDDMLHVATPTPSTDPFMLMPPDIGFHVYNGTPYLDMTYARP